MSTAWGKGGNGLPKEHNANKPANPHAGHRERLKKRFLKEGLDHFESHNALELLLFFTNPRGDVNELAHELIREFGSFSGVFDADYSRLVKVKGVGDHTATLIKLIPEIGRYYLNDRSSTGTIFNTTADVGEFVKAKFFGRKEEAVLIIGLDNKLKVLKWEMLGAGSSTSVDISVKKIADFALKVGATRVAVAHNHPSGTALPSAQDRSTTATLQRALNLLNIQLIEHIILCDNDYISFKESGFLD